MKIVFLLHSLVFCKLRITLGGRLMNKKKTQRILSLVLALTFILSGATLAVSAEENVLLTAPVLTVSPEAGTQVSAGSNSVTDATIDDVREILDSDSYDED